MAYSVNWVTRVITIPQADLLNLGGSLYQLNVVDFRKEVNRLLWVIGEGLSEPEAVNWNPSVTIGGTPYAALLEVINNYTVTFEDGQYAVNVVGANSNIGDVVNVNQVSVRPQNSAGLINLDVLLAAAYQNRVVVDQLNGQAGQVSPIGTTKFPVDTFDNAFIIAEDNGIPIIQPVGVATLNTINSDFRGYSFIGRNQQVDQLIIGSTALVEECIFDTLTISGTLDGNSVINNCRVGSINYVSGQITNSKLIPGTITVAAGAQADLINCVSGIAGGGPGQTAFVDCGGSGSLTMRGYVGGVTISNITGGGDISLDITGRVVFDASCTGGTVTVRGNCDIEDNSAGMTINDQTSYTKLCDIWAAMGLSTNATRTIEEMVSDAVTDEVAQLQSDIAAIDTSALVAAIKAKTDQMIFSKVNELDVNLKSQNDAQMYGTGTPGDLWRGTP